MDQNRLLAGLAVLAIVFLMVLRLATARQRRLAPPPAFAARQERAVSVGLFLALCAVGVIGALTAHGRNLCGEYEDRLRQHGVAVTGTVQCNPSGGWAYTYDHGGRSYEGVIHRWPEGQPIAAGAAIDLIVLPEAPSFSRPAAVLRLPSPPRVGRAHMAGGALLTLAMGLLILMTGRRRAEAAEMRAGA